MSAYRWLPVRCCCRPERLLGFLPAAPDLRNGDAVSYRTNVFGQLVELQVRRFGSLWVGDEGREVRHRSLAFKADGVDEDVIARIEELRTDLLDFV